MPSLKRSASSAPRPRECSWGERSRVMLGRDPIGDLSEGASMLGENPAARGRQLNPHAPPSARKAASSRDEPSVGKGPKLLGQRRISEADSVSHEAELDLAGAGEGCDQPQPGGVDEKSLKPVARRLLTHRRDPDEATSAELPRMPLVCPMRGQLRPQYSAAGLNCSADRSPERVRRESTQREPRGGMLSPSVQSQLRPR